MPIVTHAEFHLGDMLVRYQRPADQPGAIGLSVLPLGRAGDVAVPREHLDAAAITNLPQSWQPIRAWEVDPLVHVHRIGDAANGAFSQGRSLRGGPSTSALQFQNQTVEADDACTLIRTVLTDTRGGLECTHELYHERDDAVLRVRTTARNTGPTPLTLALLTSFSLGGITPFHSADAPGRLWVHRFRSSWSAEGRHEALRIEYLQLERSWLGYGVQCERFGQVGSMPVRGFFPFVGLEDRIAGVTWAVQLAHPGSWQLEIFRRADQLALSGGLADREFGHWTKTLAPGEGIDAPEAYLTVCSNGIDEACHRLTARLARAAAAQTPAVKRDLPIVFNEWCTSWGKPTHDNLIALADRLQSSGVSYLVIDDGWAERSGDGIQQNGDWIVNRTAFPYGLRATADAIRARGLIPGLWCEFEVVNAGAAAWEETTHQLHRDGVPLQVGTRRFWDFRDPWVHDYLHERVTRLLRENGFGYLKVDYNDTIGFGCDGAESPGEALRQHLAGVQRFFRQLRTALPDLVIENCSSGGHRLEPSMLALTAMSSFSDAHETQAIPLIAANVQRLIPATQSQVWAVVRAGDSWQRLSYSIAATFLGRMCLSGDVHTLGNREWDFVREMIRVYRELAPLIAHGYWRRYGAWDAAYQHPRGWQAVLCHAPALQRAFVVWHAFAGVAASAEIAFSGLADFKRTTEFADATCEPRLAGNMLRLTLGREWSGGVIVLEP